MSAGWKLLASSPTVEGIESAIRDYFFSESYSVLNCSPYTITYAPNPKASVLSSIRVVKQGKRYRFEAKS